MTPLREAEPATQPESSRRPSVYWLISLPLAGVLLYFALRGVDWRRVWQVASSADPLLITATCIVTACSYMVRAVRWRILLGASAKVRFPTVFWANAAGY